MTAAISSKQNDRYEGIKVIGAGLPRTGTISLRAALLQLGYSPCHHMVCIFADMGGIGQQWIQAYHERDKSTRHKILRSILHQYQAIVDFPGCFFVEDLMEIYPDAKVILGLRSSPEQWRQSISLTLDLLDDPCWYLWSIMNPLTRYLAFHACPMLEETSLTRYSAKFFSTDSTDVYVRHNDWVRKTVPKEKLLEFEPAQGWEPLCKFLGVDAPSTEFPRLHDSTAVRTGLARVKLIGIAMWVGSLAVVVGAWLAWRRWGHAVLMQSWGSWGRA